MEGNGVAQLDLVTHESAVHAALLMDLLRMVARMDPEAYRRQMMQAERDLQGACEAGGPLARRVLEQRLAFLRSVQLQVDRAAATEDA